MSDCTLALSGNMAAVVCRELLETGKFVRLLTVSEEERSGLYEAVGQGFDSFSGTGRGGEGETRFSASVIARTKGSGGKKGPFDPDPDDDDTVHTDPDALKNRPGYILRGSEQAVSTVLRVVSAHGTAFFVKSEKKPGWTEIKCVGSEQETRTVLHEIHAALV